MAIQQVDRPIVLCLDNDGHNPQTEKLIQFVAEKLLSEGRSVWIAKPKQVGQDYNDMLREQGVVAIKTHIENAIAYRDYQNQRSTTKTLKSEVLNPLNEASSRLHFDVAAASHFIQSEKEATLFTGSELEKLTQPTQKIDQHLIKQASEFMTVAGSISQQDIDRYLHTAIGNPQKTNHNPSDKAIQQSVQSGVKDKELDL